MRINYGKNWENVKLTYDNVIIKVKKKVEEKEEEYTMSEGGFLVPKAKKTKKEIYGVGEVMVVGDGYHSTDGKDKIPLRVSVGEFVVINITDPTNGNIIHEDDYYEYRLIREQSILMKSDKADTFIFD